MVTTEPNALAARIKDRMPLVLDDDCAKAWLGHTPLTAGTLRELCRPFPAERMASQAIRRQNGAVNRRSPRRIFPQRKGNCFCSNFPRQRNPTLSFVLLRQARPGHFDERWLG